MKEPLSVIIFLWVRGFLSTNITVCLRFLSCSLVIFFFKSSSYQFFGSLKQQYTHGFLKNQNKKYFIELQWHVPLCSLLGATLIFNSRGFESVQLFFFFIVPFHAVLFIFNFMCLLGLFRSTHPPPHTLTCPLTRMY